VNVMENSKKAVQTLAYGSCSHNISRPRKLDRNTENVFFFHFLNVQFYTKKDIIKCFVRLLLPLNQSDRSIDPCYMNI